MIHKANTPETIDNVQTNIDIIREWANLSRILSLTRGNNTTICYYLISRTHKRKYYNDNKHIDKKLYFVVN
jgi:hypothetical protein